MSERHAIIVWRTVADVLLLSFHVLTVYGFVEGLPWYQAPMGAGFIAFALVIAGVPFAVLSLARQWSAHFLTAIVPERWRPSIPAMTLVALAVLVDSLVLALASSRNTLDATTPARVLGGVVVALLWMLAMRAFFTLIARFALGREPTARLSVIARTVTSDVLIGLVYVTMAMATRTLTGIGREGEGSRVVELYLLPGGSSLVALAFVTPLSLVRQSVLGALRAVRSHSTAPIGRSADIISRTLMCLAATPHSVSDSLAVAVIHTLSALVVIFGWTMRFEPPAVVAEG